MNPSSFIRQLEDARIVAAIRKAEQQTTGEIRVCISKRKIVDALPAARQRFHKLGMQKTKDRNAVLIYLAPKTQVFAVVGDAGVHEKCGVSFWTQLAAQLSEDLRSLPLTEAVVNAVIRVGELLASHFPPNGSRGNELSDSVLHD